jgi:dolichol-phosphate mannosyltransferase
VLKLSAVIAAYDERENIEELTRRLDRVLRNLPGIESEIIFVVEGRDGTREILERLRPELGPIRILYSETPTGLGAAFRRGFAAVAPDADLVVTLDADLNHRPEEIPRLLEQRERSNADVLVGSRFVEGARSEGIPLWKRGVSGLMNKIIGTLFDVEALDKSSGFRVYRAEALRRLTGYRNDDFAFLPEILIRATRLGLRIAEAPIHFIFRTRGESKMSIAQTSRSYLALLRSRFDGLSIAVLFLLAVGTGLRLLFAFPIHKFPSDADSLLSGLRALDILAGKPRVFYSYLRIGALESYMHVPAIWLLGISRAAVSIAPLLSGVAALFFFYFFVREILGRRPAAVALLFLALPSPAYSWVYLPNGYAETMLLCLTTLYFAARTARTGHRDWTSLALGFSLGLGVWQSVQTLTCAVPALIWLRVRRPEVLRRGRFWLLAPAGFVLGAAPLILYNMVHPFATFEGNFAVRPAGSARSVLSNFSYFFQYDLPEILIEPNPFHAPPIFDPAMKIKGLLRLPAAAAYAAAFFALLLALRRRRGAGSDDKPAVRSGVILLVLLAATVTLVYVASEAGQTRGITERYVLPLFFVAAAALGLLVSRLWDRRRLAALAAAGAVLVFNLSGYNWPWTTYRHRLCDLDRADQVLLAFLQAKRISWICGNYWIVYPFNFLSVRQMTGIPFQPDHDHYAYARSLPQGPSNWALVTVDPNTLRVWLRNLPLEGRVNTLVNHFYVFLPSERERAKWRTGPLVDALQKTAPAGH